MITETQTIESALTGQEVAVGARYLKKTPSFELEGSLDYTLVGDLTAHKAHSIFVLYTQAKAQAPCGGEQPAENARL